MSDFFIVLIGILIPFFGTTLGSLPVYFIKKDLNDTLRRVLLGFAAGVMIAASVWSLLIPAIEMTDMKFKFIPAVVGFLIGITLLTLTDIIINRLERIPINSQNNTKSILMTAFAVTLHNIPEGMAVGVGFAAILSGEGVISYAGAFTLTMGIAIQNFPEGAIISMPLRYAGYSKNKSFIYGMLSGAVEPIGAVFMLVLTAILSPILPYILSFAAGAMIYVVSRELIPESQKPAGSTPAILGTGFGFALMMLLDVAFG